MKVCPRCHTENRDEAQRCINPQCVTSIENVQPVQPVTLRWEYLKSAGAHLSVARCKVPGGWLVHAQTTSGRMAADGPQSANLVFVPDPTHSWGRESSAAEATAAAEAQAAARDNAQASAPEPEPEPEPEPAHQTQAEYATPASEEYSAPAAEAEYSAPPSEAEPTE